MGEARQRAVASGLAERIRLARLEPAALARIAADTSQRLCVGVSGGLDSVCALLLLWALLPDVRDRLLVLHFNHGLRGKASEADQRFVEKLARDLQLEVRVGHWSAPHREEGAARTARFKFFSEMCRRHAARCVVLGHHADDVAETLVQRLARGAGVEGLSGPRPVQRLETFGLELIRPLLGLTRAELQTFARAAGVSWREDRSNSSRVHERNRLRLDVLPAIDASLGRRFAAGAASARARLDLERESLEWSAQKLREDLSASGDLSLNHLRLPESAKAPRALVERILVLWLADVSPHAFRLLPAILGEGENGRWNLPDEIVVSKAGRHLCAYRACSGPVWLGRCVRPGGTLDGQDGALLDSTLVPVPLALRKSRASSFIDSVLVSPSAIGAFLRVRCRRSGDRMQPFGSAHRVRIQDLFINRKIAESLRDQLPVVESEKGEILWVAGLPPSECARVRREDGVAVQLTYRLPRAL